MIYRISISILSILVLSSFLFHKKNASVADTQNTKLAEYYVSELGSNTNTGLSVQAPLKTIGEAVKRMKDGDRCYVLEGIYREAIEITSKRNLIISNYKNANVIVSGLDKVTGWQVYKNGIYRATFVPQEKDESSNPWHLNGRGKFFIDLFANGEIMTQARYPNLTGDILNWKTHGGEIKVKVEGSVNFTESTTKNWPANYWQGGIFHGIIEKKFNAVQGTISSNSSDKIVCSDLTAGWKKSTDEKFEEYIFSNINNEVSGIGRGFITNHLNALDSEKEWYWDKKNNTVYFMPPSRLDPKKVLIEAKSRKLAFLVSNSFNIKIEGIQMKSAGLELDNSSQCVINNCGIIYPIPFYVHLDEYNGKANIIIKGNENTISNCYVAHSWGSGIEITEGNRNTIKNSVVEDINWMGTYNACIRVGGNETNVSQNTLRKSGRFLIQGTGVKKGLIAYNDLYNGMLIGQDGGAFYTYIQDGAGTEIAFNWVHGLKGVPWERSEHEDHNITVGIYLDGGCQNFNVHHNVIWGSKYGIMYNASQGAKPNYSMGNRMNYNTCYVTGQSAIVSKNLPELYQNNEASHNLVNKKVGAIALKKENNIDQSLASQFTNNNFQLRSAYQKNQSSQIGKSISAGAYSETPLWKAGADTTKIKLIH